MAWGIFMLVVLLGLGNGMKNGVSRGFSDDATNSIWLFTGTVSIAHEGMPVGRKVVLANRDVDTVHALPGVDKITGRFFIGGGPRGNAQRIRVGNKVSSYDVRAVHPDHLYLEQTKMLSGRFLNWDDIEEKRKVVVVGQPVAEFLYETTDVIGRWININDIVFQIVGVFTDDGDEGETEKLYVPISTAQAAFNGADRVNMLMFTVGDADIEESQALAQAARSALAEAHHFSSSDPQALRVRNNVEQYQTIMQVFAMISIFVSAMAGCTILAGIVGISNIMMIVVRERTREIGLRKALGATPFSIVSSIVQEAVFLTSLAGYLGLLAGVALLEGVAAIIPAGDMFADPEVDFPIALVAMGILIVAGAVAGLFPALAAAKVNPIVALRDE
jgi:putative ABC transport system permease protein